MHFAAPVAEGFRRLRTSRAGEVETGAPTGQLRPGPSGVLDVSYRQMASYHIRFETSIHGDSTFSIPADEPLLQQSDQQHHQQAEQDDDQDGNKHPIRAIAGFCSIM